MENKIENPSNTSEIFSVYKYTGKYVRADQFEYVIAVKELLPKNKRRVPTFEAYHNCGNRKNGSIKLSDIDYLEIRWSTNVETKLSDVCKNRGYKKKKKKDEYILKLNFVECIDDILIHYTESKFLKETRSLSVFELISNDEIFIVKIKNKKKKTLGELRFNYPMF